MTLVLIFLATLLVAYANGANDNFKGVATLFGSKAVSYRQALGLATVSTCAGCVASVFLAAGLAQAFSGKGLVPDAVAANPHFLLAVALGAGCTVLLATVLAFPISTTHGLTGALAGAGVMAAGSDLRLSVLGTSFFVPLLLSPLVAVMLTLAGQRLLRLWPNGWSAKAAPCLCVGESAARPVLVGLGPAASAQVLNSPATAPLFKLGRLPECSTEFAQVARQFSTTKLLRLAHGASACVLCFARGLNDTPKIVALMWVVQALDVRQGMLAVAVAMAAGGLLNARKVAHTMSHKLAQMNDGPAFAANLVSGFLVIGASRLGLPVSTTHVCVGAIAGLGLDNGSVNTAVLRNVLLSWVLTLPLAGLFAAAAWAIIHAV
jgi:inorganic phosphate transporter, PiT family